MIEFGVIVVLAILLGWKEYQSRLERQDLFDLLASKGTDNVPQNISNLKMARNTKIKVEPSKEPDLIPTENLDQDKWEEAIGAKESGRQIS